MKTQVNFWAQKLARSSSSLKKSIICVLWKLSWVCSSFISFNNSTVFFCDYTAYVIVCVWVCQHVYWCVSPLWCEEPEHRQMVVGYVQWVLSAYIRQLLCSVGHAAALKHCFVWGAMLGYNKTFHPSASIFIQRQGCMKRPERFDLDLLPERDEP